MLSEIFVNIIWKTLSQEPFDHKTFAYNFHTHTWKKNTSQNTLFCMYSCSDWTILEYDCDAFQTKGRD
jgi:hypothetical protein